MPDVFVSYASEDRARIKPLIATIEAEGFDVWWDRDLVVGPDYDDAIEGALSQAACVIVAWSHASIRSRWVRDEANEGLGRDILVPLLIDDVQPPLGFRSAQSAKMIDWPGNAGELERLLGGVRRLVQARWPSQNPAAYAFFKQGVERALLFNRWDTQTAIEMLDRATNLDPDFTDAWAHLADACLNSVVFFENSETDLWLRAEAANAHALALDPTNIVARTTAGRMRWSAKMGFQNADALRAFAGVLREDPKAHIAGLWQACIFLHVGMAEEAKRRLSWIIEEMPKDPMGHFFLAQSNVYLGRHDDAVEQHARALSLDATNQVVNLHYPATWIYANDLNQAQASIENTRRMGQDDAILASSEALIWAKRGEWQRAEEACALTLHDMQVKPPLIHTHHVVHNLGSAYALLDRPDDAIAQIRAAAQSGLPNSTLFDSDEHLHSLHRQPEFTELLADLATESSSYRSEFLPDG